MSRGKDPFHLISSHSIFFFFFWTSIILVRCEICGIKIANGFKTMCKPYIIKQMAQS